jgi:hypothetical protein
MDLAAAGLPGWWLAAELAEPVGGLLVAVGHGVEGVGVGDGVDGVRVDVVAAGERVQACLVVLVDLLHLAVDDRPMLGDPPDTQASRLGSNRLIGDIR